jgi:hypothetical protein
MDRTNGTQGKGGPGLDLPYDFLATPESFGRFVADWEAGTLPKLMWTHAAHVAVGACYTVRYCAQAFQHIKRGILRYNAAVGTANTETSGYRETLTRFWAEVIAEVVARYSDPWNAALAAVKKFGDQRKLPALYYSFDVVSDREARRRWIPPDRARPE